MSKFHVGDKVTLHFTEEQLEQFDLKREVNLDLSGEWTVERVYDSGFGATFYNYDGQLYNVSNDEVSWDVPEETLRPARIEALSQAEVAFPAHVVESLSKVASGDLSGTVEYRPLPVAAARDSVNHPAHYTRFPVEVIEITEQLDFNRGNAVKYLCRAGFKEGVDEMEDLSKAAWYINRAIEKLQKERDNASE